MRLGEAVGLLKSDIKLDSDIPHIELKPHLWRSLKTKGSERNIPLVGFSLWACKRIIASNNDSIYSFHSNYICSKTGIKFCEQFRIERVFG